MVIEKTARKLRGTPCLELDSVAPPKQEICCSRMFGQRLHDLAPIREAVASYAARACGSVCKRVRVSIRTGMFDPDEPKFAKGMLCELSHPTDDTRLIIQAALADLDELYRPGFAFSKAEVLLMDLCGRGEFTDDLFAPIQPAHSQRVMAVLDSINAKWGRGTLRPGVVPATPTWSMRRELMSQSFTTRGISCGRCPRGSRRFTPVLPLLLEGKGLEQQKRGQGRRPVSATARLQSAATRAGQIPTRSSGESGLSPHSSADGHRQPLLLERDPVHQAVFHRVALLVLVTQQVASHEITRAHIKPQSARGVIVAQQVRCLSLDRKPVDV